MTSITWLWPNTTASVRGYLPAVLNHLRFGASPAGQPVVDAFDWLRDTTATPQSRRRAAGDDRQVLAASWCWARMAGLIFAPIPFASLISCIRRSRRRDVFAHAELALCRSACRVCWRGRNGRRCARSSAARSGCQPIRSPLWTALAAELDQTYRAVAARLPDNPAVRFEKVDAG